jgi:hypothetical protein
MNKRYRHEYTDYGEPSKGSEDFDERRCKCGCGRVVVGKALYDFQACRKRAERARKLNQIKTY